MNLLCPFPVISQVPPTLAFNSSSPLRRNLRRLLNPYPLTPSFLLALCPSSASMLTHRCLYTSHAHPPLPVCIPCSPDGWFSFTEHVALVKPPCIIQSLHNSSLPSPWTESKVWAGQVHWRAHRSAHKTYSCFEADFYFPGISSTILKCSL